MPQREMSMESQKTDNMIDLNNNQYNSIYFDDLDY